VLAKMEGNYFEKREEDLIRTAARVRGRELERRCRPASTRRRRRNEGAAAADSALADSALELQRLNHATRGARRALLGSASSGR
jgi:hypothetical protein